MTTYESQKTGPTSRYFRVAINAPFHNGEAVVRFDVEKELWHCLFTVKDQMVDEIYSQPIEMEDIVLILGDEDLEDFGKFTGKESEAEPMVEICGYSGT